jgi:hypothetical protein
MKSLTPPTPPTRPRLPTPAEMDEMSGRAILEGLKELEEEERERERCESSSKLTEKDLREAISLGVRMAEEEALWKVTMKAKQVAEHDRRRALRACPRLVYSRPMPTKSRNFTVRDTLHADGAAFRWLELPDGSWRVEQWTADGWKPGGASFSEFFDNPPVGPAFAAKLGIPADDLK